MTNLSTKVIASEIRKHTLRMVHKANASHVGSCLSIADILAVLYGKVLQFKADDQGWEYRDRYILSKGHAAAALYAVLATVGIIKVEKLNEYGEEGSLMMTHASHRINGVEFSSGSLGHGLSFGAGKALSAKKNKKKWRVFVQLSDGELDEGSNWEALMFASHHKLDNLIVIIDYNNLQSLASVNETLGIEPLADKFVAFGWSVQSVNGHDLEALEDKLNTVPWELEKPSVLIANTVKGKGVSFMENEVAWHYRSPNMDQLKIAISEVEAKE